MQISLCTFWQHGLLPAIVPITGCAVKIFTLFLCLARRLNLYRHSFFSTVPDRDRCCRLPNRQLNLGRVEILSTRRTGREQSTKQAYLKHRQAVHIPIAV